MRSIKEFAYWRPTVCVWIVSLLVVALADEANAMITHSLPASASSGNMSNNPGSFPDIDSLGNCATAGYCTESFPSGYVAGDYYVLVSDNCTTIPELTLDCDTLPATGILYLHDVSAGTWGDPVDLNFFSASDPPVIDPIGDQSAAIFSQIEFSVTASDPDGPAPLSLSISSSTPSLPVGAVFTDNGNGTGDFDWTPQIGEDAVYTVTFAATENGGQTVQQDMSITVTNSSPVMGGLSSRTVLFDELLTFPVTATDPDGPSPLSMSITSTDLPGGHSFVDNGSGSGTFSWTPAFGDIGQYTVTFAATESGPGKVTERTISISVVEELNNDCDLTVVYPSVKPSVFPSTCQQPLYEIGK